MPKLEKFSYFVNPQISVIPGAKGTGAIVPDAVDASGGYDRVVHVIQLGTMNSGGGFDAEVTESATAAGSYTLITSSGITAVTASAAKKVILIDVPVNTDKPFQKLRSTASTSGTVGIAMSAVAICYNGTRPLGKAMADVLVENFVA